MVCELNKVLYGFKQSLQFWYIWLLFFFFKWYGLICIHANHTFFITGQGLKQSIMIIFIDDIRNIKFNNMRVITKVSINFYLGLKVEKDC